MPAKSKRRASSSTAPKKPRVKIDPDDISRNTGGRLFSAGDDIAIKEAMEAGDSFASLATSGKLSQSFPTSILQQRWHTMLYDPDFIKLASKAMTKAMSLGKRAKWTDVEEKLLIDGVAHNFISFSNILSTHKAKFHPTRTPKSLEAHYYKLKRAGNLPAAVPMSSQPPPPSAPSTSSTSMTLYETAAEIEQGKIPKEEPKPEPQMPASVVLNLEHFLKPNPDHLGYSSPAAILMGRVCSFPIVSQVTSIGRLVRGSRKVDVDVSKEACSTSVSRIQAYLFIDDRKEVTDANQSRVSIKNVGKNPIIVDGNVVINGESFRVLDKSLIEFGSARFIFFLYEENIYNLPKQSNIIEDQVMEVEHVKEEDASPLVKEEDDEM
ncbi:hypothetical protein P9112_005365 [Eukaryota sp. TZLM1-RC]